MNVSEFKLELKKLITKLSNDQGLAIQSMKASTNTIDASTSHEVKYITKIDDIEIIF